MRFLRRVLSCAFVVLAPLAARAVPFDVIVMSELTVNSANFGVGFNGGWAWLVATSDTIGTADIQGMTHDLASDDPSVEASSVVFNQSSTGPLAPGQAAGGSVAGNSVFGGLLGPGESRVSSAAFLNAGFNYPEDYAGTTTLTGTYRMGDDVVTYSVLVHLSPEAVYSIDAVQRVSSVAVTCFGLTPTLSGSGKIRGTPGNDVIMGSDVSDDQIDGGGGSDTICGLGGRDRIKAKLGTFRIDGGPGDDRIQASAGGLDDCNLLGGSGNDVISFSAGGGSGGSVDGGEGEDAIKAKAGGGSSISVLGGSGDDSLKLDSGGGGGNTIDGGLGTDTCKAKGAAAVCEVVH
jgi:hypothetical protein